MTPCAEQAEQPGVQMHCTNRHAGDRRLPVWTIKASTQEAASSRPSCLGKGFLGCFVCGPPAWLELPFPPFLPIFSKKSSKERERGPGTGHSTRPHPPFGHSEFGAILNLFHCSLSPGPCLPRGGGGKEAVPFILQLAFKPWGP